MGPAFQVIPHGLSALPEQNTASRCNKRHAQQMGMFLREGSFLGLHSPLLSSVDFLLVRSLPIHPPVPGLKD